MYFHNLEKSSRLVFKNIEGANKGGQKPDKERPKGFGPKTINVAAGAGTILDQAESWMPRPEAQKRNGEKNIKSSQALKRIEETYKVTVIVKTVLENYEPDDLKKLMDAMGKLTKPQLKMIAALSVYDKNGQHVELQLNNGSAIKVDITADVDSIVRTITPSL